MKRCDKYGHRKLYSRRKRCITTFHSLTKVKNQNPQNAIMQKWKFSLLLNTLKYYKNGEMKFFRYCIVDFFNNFCDVKMSSDNHYWLPSEISWHLTLFTTRETSPNCRICSLFKKRQKDSFFQWKLRYCFLQFWYRVDTRVDTWASISLWNYVSILFKIVKTQNFKVK